MKEITKNQDLKLKEALLEAFGCSLENDVESLKYAGYEKLTDEEINNMGLAEALIKYDNNLGLWIKDKRVRFKVEYCICFTEAEINEEMLLKRSSK